LEVSQTIFQRGETMRKQLLWLGLALFLPAIPAAAQNRSTAASSVAKAAAPSSDQSVAGKWTYRSFVNTPELVGNDPNKALDLIFGEGVFTFEITPDAALKGTLDMGGGFVLDLQGTARPAAPDALLAVEIVGNGRPDTPTAGWEYDYRANLAYQWPNGVNQTPALVVTVIRAKPHDGNPAGVVASFIAVKQP
jgi:hypothetical protein